MILSAQLRDKQCPPSAHRSAKFLNSAFPPLKNSILVEKNYAELCVHAVVSQTISIQWPVPFSYLVITHIFIPKVGCRIACSGPFKTAGPAARPPARSNAFCSKFFSSSWEFYQYVLIKYREAGSKITYTQAHTHNGNAMKHSLFKFGLTVCLPGVGFKRRQIRYETLSEFWSIV